MWRIGANDGIGEIRQSTSTMNAHEDLSRRSVGVR